MIISVPWKQLVIPSQLYCADYIIHVCGEEPHSDVLHGTKHQATKISMSHFWYVAETVLEETSNRALDRMLSQLKRYQWEYQVIAGR